MRALCVLPVARRRAAIELLYNYFTMIFNIRVFSQSVPALDGVYHQQQGAADDNPELTVSHYFFLLIELLYQNSNTQKYE